MAWKSSMVLIENPADFKNEEQIIKALGIKEFEYEREALLGECIHPRDNSINICFYNGNIIICDDYRISEQIFSGPYRKRFSPEERGLVKLFPNAEIITASCHSLKRFHGYSVIQSGKKVRYKTIAAEEKLKQYGSRLPEENSLYAKSFVKNRKRKWKDESLPDEFYTEDQMMEEFTFGVSKRRMGFQLDTPEGDDLREIIKFKRYKVLDTRKEIIPEDERPLGWKVYVLIGTIVIAWLLIRKFVLKF